MRYTRSNFSIVFQVSFQMYGWDLNREKKKGTQTFLLMAAKYTVCIQNPSTDLEG